MEFGGELVYVGAPEDDEIPEYDDIDEEEEDIDEEEEDMLNPQNEDEEVCRFPLSYEILILHGVQCIRKPLT